MKESVTSVWRDWQVVRRRKREERSSLWRMRSWSSGGRDIRFGFGLVAVVSLAGSFWMVVMSGLCSGDDVSSWAGRRLAVAWSRASR